VTTSLRIIGFTVGLAAARVLALGLGLDVTVSSAGGAS